MNHLVIGDIHGCGSEFSSLLDVVEADYHPATTRIILIGDLLTKGPRPDLVVEELTRMRQQGWEIELICGNHEIRLLGAIGRLRGGLELARLDRVERETITRLMETGTLERAFAVLMEATRRIQYRTTDGPRPFTAMHAGFEPTLGIERTPDHIKMHIKARKHERDWWDRYDGEEGLVVCGHKPVPEPLMIRDEDGTPHVVNLDTGCWMGGHLSCYDVERDVIFQVRSRQPIDPKRLAFALSPTLVPTSMRSASVAHARTTAG